MKINIQNLTPLLTTYKFEYLLGLCALVFAYIISTSLKKARNNLPPRVIGLPIVGYLPFLTKNMFFDFIRLGKKYGDVFSIKIGSQDIVVLNGGEAIREAFNKQELVGRPPYSAVQKVFTSSAFFGNNILHWKEQRRAVFQFMRDPLFGKTKIEENIVEEINYLMDFLRSTETQPIDLRKPLCSSIMNNVCSLIIGKRFEYDDPQLEFQLEYMEQFFKHFTQNSLDVMFPWICYIPFASKFQHFYKSKTALEKYENFLLKEMTEHLQTLDPTHIRDFMDRYLVELDNQRAMNPDTSFSQNMLIKNCVDLILAGNETVEASLLWSIYIIAAFPAVQKKIQTEIMEVIGPHKTPEYMDIKNTPYTHAVILEIMRWKCVVPLIFVRCASSDTTVCGYNIQKDTTVLPNLWAAHHDPKTWDKPEEFNPERFLSKDGMSVVKPIHLMQYSVGKRSCPGEPIANMELYLYITCILRDFDIVFPDKKEPTFKGDFFLIYRPEPYMVQFFPKN